VDVCNIGNVSPLDAINHDSVVSISDCAGVGVPVVSVSSVTTGSGPSSLCASGSCVDYVTDLSGLSPYSYMLTSLNA